MVLVTSFEPPYPAFPEAHPTLNYQPGKPISLSSQPVGIWLSVITSLFIFLL